MLFKWGKNEVFAASFFRLIFGRKISPLLNTLLYGMRKMRRNNLFN
jgi:hypothetical protein